MYNSWSVTTLFPKCLTLFLFCWTAFVTWTRIDSHLDSGLARTCLIVFLTLSVYTYIKVIYVGPGSPLEFPELRIRNIAKAEAGSELPPDTLSKNSLTLKSNGRYRLCQTCQVWKPDRCHHCSGCDRCILKMDHHCPWFAECVGYSNQKYFLQFLCYTTLYAYYVLLLTSIRFYHWFHNQTYEREVLDLVLLLDWILAISVSIAMTIFTSFSVYQLSKNETTIEMHALRRYRQELEIYNESSNISPLADHNVFNLGSWKLNLQEVMGTTWLSWLLPIHKQYLPHEDDSKGLYFKVRAEVRQNLLESAHLQHQLMERLTPRSSIDF